MSRYVRCNLCHRWFWGKHRMQAIVGHSKDAHGIVLLPSSVRDYSGSEQRRIDAEENSGRELPDGAWHAMHRREIDAMLRERDG